MNIVLKKAEVLRTKEADEADNKRTEGDGSVLLLVGCVLCVGCRCGVEMCCVMCVVCGTRSSVVCECGRVYALLFFTCVCERACVCETVSCVGVFMRCCSVRRFFRVSELEPWMLSTAQSVVSCVSAPPCVSLVCLCDCQVLNDVSRFFSVRGWAKVVALRLRLQGIGLQLGIVDAVSVGLSPVVQRGKLARGASALDFYEFGDFSRGVLAAGKQSRGASMDDGYKFGDITRGLVRSATGL